MKGFKIKIDTVCFEFRKMLLAAACSFGKKRDQGGGWNKMPGERRGLNAWEMGPRETLNPWCGDQCGCGLYWSPVNPVLPGLLRFSDSVLKTPYLSNTKYLLISLYNPWPHNALHLSFPSLSFPCLQSGGHQDLPCKVARNWGLVCGQHLKQGRWSICGRQFCSKCWKYRYCQERTESYGDKTDQKGRTEVRNIPVLVCSWWPGLLWFLGFWLGKLCPDLFACFQVLSGIPVGHQAPYNCSLKAFSVPPFDLKLPWV